MLDWNKIDTVLLDMDGTLLDLYFDNYFWQHHLPESYARKNNISLQEARNVIFPQFSAVHGTLHWYCLDYWTATLQINILRLKREIRHLVAIRPGVIAFLNFLREHKKRVVLITNAHRDSLNLKMQHTGLDVLLDRLISSHDFGCPKEAPAFWQELLESEHMVAQRVMFIDDTQVMLDMAKQFGIGALFGIYQPDSRAEPKQQGDYVLLRNFSELYT